MHGWIGVKIPHHWDKKGGGSEPWHFFFWSKKDSDCFWTGWELCKQWVVCMVLVNMVKQLTQKKRTEQSDLKVLILSSSSSSKRGRQSIPLIYCHTSQSWCWPRGKNWPLDNCPDKLPRTHSQTYQISNVFWGRKFLPGGKQAMIKVKMHGTTNLHKKPHLRFMQSTPTPTTWPTWMSLCEKLQNTMLL